MVYSIEKKNSIIVEVFALMAEAEITDIIKESGYIADEIKTAAKANSIYAVSDKQMNTIVSGLTKFLARNFTLFLIVGIDDIKDDIDKIDDKVKIDSYDGVEFYCRLLQGFLFDGNNSKFSLLIDSAFETFIGQFEQQCLDGLGGKITNMKLVSDMIHNIEVLASTRFPEYKECTRNLTKYALYDVLPILAECVRRG